MPTPLFWGRGYFAQKMKFLLKLFPPSNKYVSDIGRLLASGQYEVSAQYMAIELMALLRQEIITGKEFDIEILSKAINFVVEEN